MHPKQQAFEHSPLQEMISEFISFGLSASVLTDSPPKQAVKTKNSITIKYFNIFLFLNSKIEIEY